MKDAGAGALAEALKAMVVTCGHEVHWERVRVFLKMKQKQSDVKSYSCGFFHSGSLASVTEGTAHQCPEKCVAGMFCVNVARCYNKTIKFNL